jgi:hypothetical protein
MGNELLEKNMTIERIVITYQRYFLKMQKAKLIYQILQKYDPDDAFGQRLIERIRNDFNRYNSSQNYCTCSKDQLLFLLEMFEINGNDRSKWLSKLSDVIISIIAWNFNDLWYDSVIQKKIKSLILNKDNKNDIYLLFNLFDINSEDLPDTIINKGIDKIIKNIKTKEESMI